MLLCLVWMLGADGRHWEESSVCGQKSQFYVRNLEQVDTPAWTPGLWKNLTLVKKPLKHKLILCTKYMNISVEP